MLLFPGKLCCEVGKEVRTFQDKYKLSLVMTTKEDNEINIMYTGGRSPGKCLLGGKTVNNQLGPLETWGI